MNIIVTSPNLNEKYNISGISSIVSNFVKGQEEDYTIFITGKKDKERRDFKWLKKQLILLRKYYNLLNEKKIDIVHINHHDAGLQSQLRGDRRAEGSRGLAGLVDCRQ